MYINILGVKRANIDEVAPVLTICQLRGFYKDLLGLFGIYTLEDITQVDTVFVEKMEKKIRENGLIGVGADFRKVQDQMSYLGRQGDEESMKHFEFNELDRAKLTGKLANIAQDIIVKQADLKLQSEFKLAKRRIRSVAESR